MMIPTCPCTNFIIRKPGLALGSLETVLYTMFGLDNTRQLFQRCVRRCIGKIVIILYFAVSIRRTRNYQKFFCKIMPTSFGSSYNASLNNLYNQRTFFTISNIDSSPGIIAQRTTPYINTPKRLLRRLKGLTNCSKRFSIPLKTCSLISASLRIFCFCISNRRSIVLPFHGDYSLES